MHSLKYAVDRTAGDVLPLLGNRVFFLFHMLEGEGDLLWIM
jgi:hypothetical protein